MKLLLASSFLVLTWVSGFANATGLSGKESIIFTSSPPPDIDQENRLSNITTQYRWINNYNSKAQHVVGVVINGDLIKWDNVHDLSTIDHLLATLKVPYLLGLGSTDYILNKDTCPICAVRSVWHFNRHIVKKMISEKKAPYAHIGKVNYDFSETTSGATDGSKQTKGYGSLGYAVELGANKNIYLIQLNSHVGADADTDAGNNFELKGEDRDFDVSYDDFLISPVIEFLKDALEYAAQYPQNNANHTDALPKTVVVTMNGNSIHPTILATLDHYPFALRFLGNDGTSDHCKKKNDIADKSKFYCVGVSTKAELHELVLDYDKNTFDVVHHTLSGDSNNPTQSSYPVQSNVGFYPIQSCYSTGTCPTQDK